MSSRRPRKPVDPPVMLGWREWLTLPELGIQRIRAKIDTGARTSAIHAEDIEYCVKEGQKWVVFNVHPLGPGKEPITRVEAPLIEHRVVTSSSGQSTMRPFVYTHVIIGDRTIETELSLSNRDNLRFPMLLGRTAMQGVATVDPSRSWLLGKR